MVVAGRGALVYDLGDGQYAARCQACQWASAPATLDGAAELAAAHRLVCEADR
jgi:hypothetical protein